MPRLVTTVEQALSHVARYQTEIERSKELNSRVSYAPAWYAVRNEAEGWIFAPSKFVGYDYPSAEDYLADSGKRGDRDGRQTERLLSQWFAVVPPESRLGRELSERLRQQLARYNRTPNARARISVLKSELDEASASNRLRGGGLLDRIASDPAICGGRPCIRGTRMRVSDVVAMIAHGADRAEILSDYDYLTDDDLSAALAYAAQAADHRVIQAA